MRHLAGWILFAMIIILTKVFAQQPAEVFSCLPSNVSMISEFVSGHQELVTTDPAGKKQQLKHEMKLTADGFSVVWHKLGQMRIDYELYVTRQRCAIDHAKWNFVIDLYQPMYLGISRPKAKPTKPNGS